MLLNQLVIPKIFIFVKIVTVRMVNSTDYWSMNNHEFANLCEIERFGEKAWFMSQRNTNQDQEDRIVNMFRYCIKCARIRTGKISQHYVSKWTSFYII